MTAISDLNDDGPSQKLLECGTVCKTKFSFVNFSCALVSKKLKWVSTVGEPLRSGHSLLTCSGATKTETSRRSTSKVIIIQEWEQCRTHGQYWPLRSVFSSTWRSCIPLALLQLGSIGWRIESGVDFVVWQTNGARWSSLFECIPPNMTEEGLIEHGLQGRLLNKQFRKGSNPLHPAAQTWNVLGSHNHQYGAWAGWGIWRVILCLLEI